MKFVDDDDDDDDDTELCLNVLMLTHRYMQNRMHCT